MKKDFSCGTIDFHEIDTLGQELAGNVVFIENKSADKVSCGLDVGPHLYNSILILCHDNIHVLYIFKELVTVLLPYDPKGIAPYKDHQVIYHDNALNKWLPLKSTKSNGEVTHDTSTNTMTLPS